MHRCRCENVTHVRKDHNHWVDPLSRQDTVQSSRRFVDSSLIPLPRVMVLDMVPAVFPALHSQTAARSLELGLATTSTCTERSGRDTSGRTSTWNIASLSGVTKLWGRNKQAL